MIDRDKIKAILYKEKWTEVYNKNNVNECFNEFQKIIRRVIDRSTIFNSINFKKRLLKECMSTLYSNVLLRIIIFWKLENKHITLE